MKCSTIDRNLYQISLDQKLPGFGDFINCWLYKSDEITFLVDPGPAYSIEQLIHTLKRMGVNRLDYCLLTHIHIDHAGGAGALLKHFPETRFVCHPKAVRHMVSPDILWRGSVKTLGEIAESYGQIIPIPETAFESSGQLQTRGGQIDVIETPGHAVHHLSFQFQDCLFAGEAAGFFYQLEQGLYTRPATPPRFKPDIFLASIDRILQLDASMVCFGHHGFRTDVQTALKNAKAQLLLWIDIVRDKIKKEGEKDLVERTIPVLKGRDTAFANIKHLSRDIRQREEYFTGNSLIGMAEYLAETNTG